MDSCIPAIYAFILTCELRGPTPITAFACTVTQLGMKKYHFLYYEPPYCSFDLGIFSWTFLLH